MRHKQTALQRWGYMERERLTEDPEEGRNPETEIQRRGPRETNTKNTGPKRETKTQRETET